MFDDVLRGDPGDDLSVAAVEALRSSAAVRACAEAVELRAIATLVQVRRTQARVASHRRTAVRRREVHSRAARPALVDLEAVDRCTAQEVSLALWLSPVAARARMQLALELVEVRPATFDALRSGTIDLVRAQRIVDAVRTLGSEPLTGTDTDQPQDAASAVEAEALHPGSVALLADLRPGRPAAELTPAQLTARLMRLVLRASPTSAVRRTEVADERRACTLRVLPDGMALLSVTGRVELLGAAFVRIDAVARALLRASTSGARAPVATVAASSDSLAVEVSAALTATATDTDTDTATDTDTDTATDTATVPSGSDPVDPGDLASASACCGHGQSPRGPHDAGRTLDQTRVDVLLASLLGHSDDRGRAVGVQVTLALVAPAATVLAGRDEPGELSGLGPVPAPLVRALAADAAWVRWTSDPRSGRIVGVGRRRYRPTAAVADLVRARDGHCRFPSCRRRAPACDLDHVVPFPDGPTEPGNLIALCRTHHLAKHRGGFELRTEPDGTARWTTPTAQEVIDPPQVWGGPPPTPPAESSQGRLVGAGLDPPPF